MCNTQQLHSTEPADSDADSRHDQDLSSPVPDASSGRTDSARLASTDKADGLPYRGTSNLGQPPTSSNTRLGADKGEAASTAADVDDSDVGYKESPVASHLHQAAAASTAVHTEAEQASGPGRGGQKRKRQPTKVAEQPEAVAAVQAQPTSRIRGQEHSTPLQLQSKKGKAQANPTPRYAAATAEQVQAGNDDRDAPNSLRRTGRQRKLTAAAAAAVEEFPSLYRQPTHAPTRFRHSPAADSAGTSEDASAEAPESSGRAAKRGFAKHSRTRESPALPGLNHVQMRQLVRYGVIPAGTHEFMYDSKHPCEVEVLPDGGILT